MKIVSLKIEETEINAMVPDVVIDLLRKIMSNYVEYHDEEPEVVMEYDKDGEYTWEQINDMFVEKYPEVSESTNSNQIGGLRSVYRKLNINRENGKVSLKDYDDYILVLDAIKSNAIGTQKTWIASILKLYRIFGIQNNTYRNVFDQLVEQVNAQVEEKKDDSVRDILNDQIIQNKMNKFNGDTLKDRQKRLIIRLYTEMPPLRLDWADVQFSCIDIPNENWLDTKNGKLYLRKHKTVRKVGTMEIDIPDSIMEDIYELIDFRDRLNIESTYLFLVTNSKKYEKMRKNGFGKIIRTTLGYTAGKLRKWYISNHIDAEQIEAHTQLAEQMGHTRYSQETYYLRRN